MKALFVLLFTMLLTACSAAPVTQVENALPPQAEQTEEVPLQEEKPVIRYLADTVVYGETVEAEDGTHLISYAAAIPNLTAWREDGAQITEAATLEEEQALAVAESFNERFAVWYAEETFREMTKAAAEDLKWFREEELEWYGGYQLELDCSVYQTEHLVSVSGTYYANTGGAHPNTYFLGWTFDLTNGMFFGEESLAEHAELKEVICQELIRQAKERAAEEGLTAEELFWPEYETIIADWPSYAVSLDESGMTVAFSPYELAAYAVGPQKFSMTYDWLSDHLDADSMETLGLH